MKRCEIKHRRWGFTLIELLVVISIIALLLSVALPAMRKAKETARFIVCMSNLKQYGIAGRMYLDDNDEKFPNAQRWLYDVGGDLIVPCRWHDASVHANGLLWSYLEDMGVHMCPTFYVLSRTMGADHLNHDPSIPIDPQFSYSMNAYLGLGYGISGFGEIEKATQIKNPARVIFFSEENCWIRDGKNWMPLNNNMLFIQETDSPNNIASYHKTKGGDVNSGVANIVFVDGSLGTGSAEQGYELANPRL